MKCNLFHVEYLLHSNILLNNKLITSKICTTNHRANDKVANFVPYDILSFPNVRGDCKIIKT